MPDKDAEHEVADDGDAAGGRRDPGARREIQFREAFLDKAIALLESGGQSRGRRQLHGQEGNHIERRNEP